MKHFILRFSLCFLVFINIQTLVFAQESPEIGRYQSTKTNNREKYAPDRILVKYKKGESKRNILKKQKIEKVENSFGLESESLGTEGGLEDLAVVTSKDGQAIDVPLAVAEFKKLPEVEYAEPDYLVKASFEPNDYYYNISDPADPYHMKFQWGVGKIQANLAWDLTQGDANSNVIIAMIDSGIMSNHPDLAGKVTAFYNCMQTSGCITTNAYDQNGHGTMTAGVASALTNNSIGVAGIGYQTKLVSFRALDANGDGYVSYTINALNQIRSLYQGSGKKVIINMSLGGPDYVQSEETAVNSAWQAGFLLVGAAGNDGVNSYDYPSAFTNVIAVGATDRFDNKTSYSNWGTWVDLAAPGGLCPLDHDYDCIISTLYDPSGYYLYGVADGTSFSAPFVSGAASLVWARNPNLTNSQVRQILESTTDSISGVGTYWSHGRLNAFRAVQAASDTPINVTDLVNMIRNISATGPVSSDLDNSGIVNILDLSILLSNFGK